MLGRSPWRWGSVDPVDWLLTLLGYIPGLVHAIWVIATH
ncbi:YqaE/Pmp3 family membrane protein [Chloroflexota bacterium]